MSQCAHIDTHLQNKDFLHKLTIGVNWGLYASNNSAKVRTTQSGMI